MGWRRFLQVKAAGGYAAFLASQTGEQSEDAWREVFDERTGDVWYYNPKTGESQWELPLELGPLARVSNSRGASASTMTERPSTSGFLPSIRQKELLPPSTAPSRTAAGRMITTPSSSGGMRPMSVSSFGGDSDGGGRWTPARPSSKAGAARPGTSSSTRVTFEDTMHDGAHFGYLEEVAHQTGVSELVAAAAGALNPARWSSPSDDGPPPWQPKSESVGSASISGSGSEDDDSDDSDATDAPSEITDGDEMKASTASARLFLPDGSPDLKLRDTVRNALKQSKFDSVSTLLASMPPGERKAHTAVPQKKRSSLGAVMRRQMVSVIGSDRAQTARRAGKQRLKSNAKSPAGPGKRKKKKKAVLPPHIYDISHDGTTLKDLEAERDGVEDGATIPAGATAKEIFEAGRTGKKPKNMCFMCWSSGNDKVKQCGLHRKKGGKKAPEDSVMICSNWDIEALRRKFRAEEIHEIFAKSNSSLRWDMNRKRFITVVQATHPVYRACFEALALFNTRVKRKDRVMAWFHSVMDAIRMNKIASKKGAKRCSLMRARASIANHQWIQGFKKTVEVLQPRPPVTEDDIVLGGRGANAFNLLRGWVILHREKEGPSTRIFRVMAPTAKPLGLYKHKVYSPMAARHGRVPAPSYTFTEDPNGLGGGKNERMSQHDPAAWFERLCWQLSSDAVSKAQKEVLDQVPPVAQRRTKHPPPSTTKYATFSRRKTKAMRAIGGLPMMTVLSLNVTTTMPAQYGNFIVTTKQSVAPIKKKYAEFAGSDGYIDASLTFKSLDAPRMIPPCSAEVLSSSLDSRVAPGITSSTCTYTVTNEEAPWYHGQNRPGDTGESESHGFRTTKPTDGLPADPGYETVEFVPSIDVAVPNGSGIQGTVTTRAGVDYPFCVPTTRGTSCSIISTFSSPLDPIQTAQAVLPASEGKTQASMGVSETYPTISESWRCASTGALPTFRRRTSRSTRPRMA